MLLSMNALTGEHLLYPGSLAKSVATVVRDTANYSDCFIKISVLLSMLALRQATTANNRPLFVACYIAPVSRRSGRAPSTYF